MALDPIDSEPSVDRCKVLAFPDPGTAQADGEVHMTPEERIEFLEARLHKAEVEKAAAEGCFVAPVGGHEKEAKRRLPRKFALAPHHVHELEHPMLLKILLARVVSGSAVAWDSSLRTFVGS